MIHREHDPTIRYDRFETLENDNDIVNSEYELTNILFFLALFDDYFTSKKLLGSMISHFTRPLMHFKSYKAGKKPQDL